jgi:hypothetical protein
MQNKGILRSSFQTELESEALRNAWDQSERVRWILDHLDEYIERWLGFSALRINSRSLIKSDLFTVVDVAVEALEQEFAQSSSPHAPLQVRSVRDAVEALQEHGLPEQANALKAAVLELRRTVLPST